MTNMNIKTEGATMNTELTIETLADRADLPELFLGTGNTSIEQILAKIEAEARALVIDVTTKSGQDQCRSLAHKIAKAKSALDAAGKSKKDEYTVTTKRIDEDRRLAKDRLSALQDEIMKAQKEAAEEKRKADEAHVQSIEMDIFKFLHKKAGLHSRQAEAVVGALMAGHVPHTKVTV